MKERMAYAYEKLATVANFAEITKAWETTTIEVLFLQNGIDISSFICQGIVFGRVSPDDMPIYCLMAEMKHFLAGIFCNCGRRTDCKQYIDQETRICRESDGDYGFHLTNAWERWSLVLLYSVIFAQRDFDPREMQAARRDPDPGCLVEYIENRVPKFCLYGHFFNKYKSKTLLEYRLRSLLDRGRSVLPKCYCIAHSRRRELEISFHVSTKSPILEAEVV